MLFLLSEDHPSRFPDPALAEQEPNGLLAVGGDLSAARLLAAYRLGIFPWYGDRQPILWWSPDPRLVLFPRDLRVSRSLRRTLRRDLYEVSLDLDFGGVVRGCAAPRPAADGTWILPEMQRAYVWLHQLGHAHSVEVWQGASLVGGLYGVAVGCAFFGESMFSRATDASKVALVHLARHLDLWDYDLVDCQVYTPHLASLGAVEMARTDFQERLAPAVERAPHSRAWLRPATDRRPSGDLPQAAGP
jgi:leucyl/phenylalanyl-tRNA--protein transferase